MAGTEVDNGCATEEIRDLDQEIAACVRRLGGSDASLIGRLREAEKDRQKLLECLEFLVHAGEMFESDQPGLLFSAVVYHCRNESSPFGEHQRRLRRVK